MKNPFRFTAMIKYNRRQLMICLIVPAIFITSTAYATPVYKSIDEYGHVTYSAIPPDDATLIEEINILTDFEFATTIDTGSNREQIKAVGEQLEEDRKLREQARADAQKKLAEEMEQREAQKPVEPVVHYYPVFTAPHHHHHHGKTRPSRKHSRQLPTPKPRKPIPHLPIAEIIDHTLANH